MSSLMTGVLNELKSENQRLENELVFANKCLVVLFKFKNNLIHILDNHLSSQTVSLTSDDIHLFRDIEEEYNSVLREKDIKCEDNGNQLEIISKQKSIAIDGSEDTIVLDKPLIKIESNFVKTEQKMSPNVSNLHKSIKTYSIRKPLNSKSTSLPNIVNIIRPQISSNTNRLSGQLASTNKLAIVKNGLLTYLMPITSPVSKILISSKSMVSNDIPVVKGVTPISSNTVPPVQPILLNNGLKPKNLKLGFHPKDKHTIPLMPVINITGQLVPMKTNIENKYLSLPFKCEICPRAFAQKVELTKHILNDQCKFRRCEINGCLFKCNLLGELDIHYMKCHKDYRRFKCNTCGKSFKTVKHCSNHKKIHNERTLQCSYPGCGKLFNTQNYLNQHNLVHTNDNPFCCDVTDCKYRAKTKWRLNYHKKYVHTNQRPFVCGVDGCQNSFKNIPQLNSHKKFVHSIENNQYFKCQFQGCNKVFRCKRLLESHFRLHSSKTLSCEWPGCQYTTNTKQKLLCHNRRHSDERKYMCDWPECGKTFKVKAHLKYHNKVHTDQKPFSCVWPGCDYRCRNSGNLAVHQRVHNK